MEELVLNDISLDESQARVTIVGVPDRPGVAAQVFQDVACRRHLRRYDRTELQRLSGKDQR